MSRAERGFAPLGDARAQILILGSLPGRASLAAGQYYAQPRNAFWRILADAFGGDAQADYAGRVAALHAARIAVWDVCAQAVRPGSLDAAIELDSVVVNDFAGFHAAHPALERVLFNGATAAELYRRRVLPSLPADRAALPALRLPSTSPAHAGMPYAEKLAAWSAALRLSPAAGPRARSHPRRRPR